MAIKPKSSIDKMIDQTDGVANPDTGEEDATVLDTQPSFKKFEDSRIPISKHAGNLWKSRHDMGLSKVKNNNSHEAWDEAVRYYKNDQTGKRNRDNADAPSRGSEKDITGGLFSQTENIVFANVSALVPSIYAKNPDCSVHSPKGDEDLEFTTCAQKLLRTLMQKRTAPGLNLKPKMRRAVVMTTLTNIGYIEVGYTKREVAVEGTLAEIDQIAAQMEAAKDQKEIRELEGQLQALDDKVDLLQPAGPWTKFLNPKDVIMDPDGTMIDGTDSKWLMIRDVYDTEFINAVYRKKNEEGQYESIYRPTHVVRASSSDRNIAGHDPEITNFSLLKDEGEAYHKFGFDSEHAYKKACKTFVWKVWDRITRRVYMFNQDDWTWPIWVWDDPYGFDDFFPLVPLAFHTDPEDMYARGEVSYYLDQQDEINRINSQVSKMRHRVSNTLVYNKRAIKKESDIINLVKPSTGDGLVGVDVPEGMKIADMLSAPPIPAVEYAQLFDKKSLFEAADRVSGVSSVVKGVEYKTNTTNKAIDSYESSTATRLDEKTDAVEECIGRIGQMVLSLCLQFMAKEEVIRLIGAENAANWPGGNMAALEAQQQFSLTVTGGSSLKPTSKTRKEQAKELGQTIGQFGQANPMAFYIVLKMLHRAYSDELVMEKSDWDLLDSSTQQLVGAQAQAAAPKPAAPAGPPNGAEGAAQAEQANAVDPQAIVKQISDMFKKMPDAIRTGVGQDIAKGVPLEDILSKLQHLQGAGAGNGQPRH